MNLFVLIVSFLFALQDMLLQLFRRGPSTDGIFRKSALMKTVKQLRLELEEGILRIINYNYFTIIMISVTAFICSDDNHYYFICGVAVVWWSSTF